MNNDTLIKQGINYSDKFFEILKERIIKQLGKSKDLEDFLSRTKEFTVENPLTSTDYVDTMTNIVLAGMSNAEFIRATQREVVRTAIQDATASLIVNVGEDLKQTIRDTVKAGFDDGLHSTEIAQNITKEVDTINRTRARTIARTEISRALTVSDYIVNKERGAIGFTVVCRPDCCPVCAKDYARVTDKQFSSNYKQIQNLSRQLKNNPRREDANDIKQAISGLEQAQDSITGSTNGKLIGGKYQFSMSQTDMLPPRHPNCRCSATYVYNDSDFRSQVTVKKTIKGD